MIRLTTGLEVRHVFDRCEQLAEWTATVAGVRVHGTTDERLVDRFAGATGWCRRARVVRSDSGTADAGGGGRLPGERRHESVAGAVHLASHVREARELLKARERLGGDAVAALYAEDVGQVEMMNRRRPEGDRRGRAQLVADIERSKWIPLSQKDEVTKAVGAGYLVVEYEWSGVLAVALGSLASGDIEETRRLR